MQTIFDNLNHTISGTINEYVLEQIQKFSEIVASKSEGKFTTQDVMGMWNDFATSTKVSPTKVSQTKVSPTKAVEVDEMSTENLNLLTVPQLKEKLKSLNITVNSKASKASLVSRLQEEVKPSQEEVKVKIEPYEDFVEVSFSKEQLMAMNLTELKNLLSSRRIEFNKQSRTKDYLIERWQNYTESNLPKLEIVSDDANEEEVSDIE